MFHQTNVKPSWGSQFGLYRYRSPNLANYREDSVRIKKSLAVAGFVMVFVFVIIIWSFVFLSGEEIMVTPDKVNFTEYLPDLTPSLDVTPETRTNYDEMYDETTYAGDLSSMESNDSSEAQFALPLQEKSRSPMLAARRQINLEDPRLFNYVWTGPKPSAFQKPNRRQVHDNIREIINQLTEDPKYETQMESSEAISRRAYKISGIYSIPKNRDRHTGTQLNSVDQPSRYNGPFYSFRPASPLEVNLLAHGAHIDPNLRVINNSPGFYNKNIEQSYNYNSGNVYQNNNKNTQLLNNYIPLAKPRARPPLSLMLDIIPTGNENQSAKPTISNNNRPQLQYYSGQNPANNHHQQQYIPVIPKHRFHNINQRQLQQQHQNDYYNKYYKNRYFGNNEYLNYGKPYFVRKPDLTGTQELNKANRMVIHLNLFPEDKDREADVGIGAFAKKSDDDEHSQIDHANQTHENHLENVSSEQVNKFKKDEGNINSKSKIVRQNLIPKSI